MRIRIKKQTALALDPRTTVFFEKGEFVEIDDKGLSETNLKRLLEIGLAVDVSTSVLPESDEIDESEIDEPGAGEPIYRSFTSKKDLEKHALERYGIDLDRRKSLEGMIEDLEFELELNTETEDK